MEHMPLGGGAPETAFDVPLDHILQSSRGQDWGGIDIADVVHPHSDFALPAIARHVLVINLGGPIEAQERLAGRQGRLSTGSLTILPAGASGVWHLDHKEEVRHLHFYLPPALIHKIAAEADINPATVELLDTIGVHDPQIETLVLSFLRELRSGGLGGKIYVESLANLLVVHLLRHHSSVQQPQLSSSHTGLPRATLRSVFSYIEDQLNTDLSLSAIAATVNLSPYHFARLFKASTGLTPHQYVIRRRIERAKLLLSTTNQPLVVIALAVGFASESHLALHFKRLTGCSPSQYR